MLENTLNLKIVPIDSLSLPEEEANPTEVYRLGERIGKEKVQRNPITITKLGKDKYFVIDGTKRVMALSDLGCAHVLAQIVDYFSNDVRLLRWVYTLFDTTVNEVRDRLSPMKNIKLSNEEKDAIATIYYNDGKLYISGNKEDILALAPEIIKAFPDKRITRLAKYHDLNDLYKAYNNNGVLIEFADVDKKKIAEQLLSKKRISLGHIRHSIMGRVLLANIDLALLKSKISTEEKNRILEEEIRAKLREGGIRYYSEPVFVFNE